MEKIVSLCKRRGFVFQSSEIYGGIGGFWDYGPLGVELKRNIKEAWWREMVTGHNETVAPVGAPSTYEMVGLDTTLITHPQVWKASGHFDLFYDLMVDCKTCKARFRADHVESLRCPRKPSLAPGEHGECDLTEPREFNLMFKTYIGALLDPTAEAYLRPETAQGMFVNFKNVLSTSRVKLPFGIAQVGRSFRNEITPRNFIFRSREFEQMEMEFFCTPESSATWYEYWRDRRVAWYESLGLDSDRLRLREHGPDERAHYSCGTADIEYAYPFLEEGEFGELEGVSHRGDFDLRSHIEGKLIREGDELVVECNEDGTPRHPGSGKDLSYFDDATGEKIIPHVIEPAGGADRTALAFLCEAYAEDAIPDENDVPQERVVLRLHPQLAPVKVAVFPLTKKDGMPERARELYGDLKAVCNAAYDEKGSIGRRYRRQDESGTPFCVTVDGQTGEDGTVTVRDRDSTKQQRVPGDELVAILRERLHLP
ncbi:MAG: glycine--tRNA ligase [Candidatus Bipolaricaulota bacterium]|nr:MAG: glycine--tRNA ligase [Candidatus Bipolaricaulota bacterium]